MQQRALMLEADPLLGKQRLASPHRELVLSRYPITIIYRVRGGRVIISRILPGI
jgi:plasmid stabilization system protein ParE